MSDTKVTRRDIKSKLVEIQGEATDQVAGAKNQLITVGAGLGLLLVIIAFFVGRKAGIRKNTVIEITRS